MTTPSPVAVLFDAVAASPFRVAPEAAASLNRVVSDKALTMEFVEDSRVFAELVPSKNLVRLGIPFLEVLWAAAHAFIVTFHEYQLAQRRSEKFFKVGGTDRNRKAYQLYRELLVAHAHTNPRDWPAPEIQPVRIPGHGTDQHVANELFLVAISWIIHHEIAHCRLDHQELTVNSVQQEIQADNAATKWVCEGALEAGPLLKRAMGMVTANLVLLAYDLERGRIQFLTHPPTFERLMLNLDATGLAENDTIFAFAFVLLDILLTQADLEYLADRDGSLRDMCVSACMALHALARKGA